jgi:polysaccharide export outer membrane protein
MSKIQKTVLQTLAIFFLVIELSSCTSSRKVIYFNDLKDSTAGSLRKAQVNFEAPIQKNDQLSIVVGGTNPDDLGIINSAGGGGSSSMASSSSNQSAGGSSSGASTGYLVEADGTIKMPFLGKVQVEGLTRLQLESKLTEMFSLYTKNPVVNVRFLNYMFSVMGEVNARGRFSMTNERTTILEALSMAGDVTEFGRRENVLIVREENGQRQFARVNLLSKDLFTSPYFYLKTNDLVYVEPLKARFISRSGLPQYIAIAAGGLSLLITIINVSK